MKHLFVFVTFIAFLQIPILSQEIGNASFYSKKMNGHRTSDGGRYYNDSLTCAHKTWAFGTLLRVVNLKNKNEVIVKVTDRGPHTRNRVIDLSFSAAERLDIIRTGIAKVSITKIEQLPLFMQLIPIPYVSLQVRNFPFLKPEFVHY